MSKQKIYIHKERVENSYLIGSKCKDCGAISFPPRVICYQCFGESLVEIPLGKRGTLVSFTVAHVAPEGFVPPLVQGYVDLYDGVRLFGQIVDCVPSWDSLELGQEMEIIFDTTEDTEGNRQPVFRFRPYKRNEGKK